MYRAVFVNVDVPWGSPQGTAGQMGHTVFRRREKEERKKRSALIHCVERRSIQKRTHLKSDGKMNQIEVQIANAKIRKTAFAVSADMLLGMVGVPKLAGHPKIFPTNHTLVDGCLDTGSNLALVAVVCRPQQYSLIKCNDDLDAVVQGLRQIAQEACREVERQKKIGTSCKDQCECHVIECSSGT